MSDPIEILVADLKPVAPRSAGMMLALCLALAVACGLATVTLTIGWRADWRTVEGNGGFWLAGGMLFLTLFASTRLCISLALPGARVTRAMRLLPFAGVALALGSFVVLHVASDLGGIAATGLAASGWRCSAALSLLAIVPGLSLLLLLRRLAVVDVQLAASAWGLAMAAAGALAIGCHCDDSHALHLLIFHGLPLVLFPLVVRTFGKSLLRW